MVICIITIMITIIINISMIALRFLASNSCSTIPDERCPEFLESVLRQGVPVIAEGNDINFPQVFIRSKRVVKKTFKLKFFSIFAIIFFLGPEDLFL